MVAIRAQSQRQGERMGRRRWRAYDPLLLLAGLLVACGCGGDGDGGPGPGDVTPPAIVEGPWAEEVTAHSADVRWRTDEASRSTVFWSPDTTSGWGEAVDSTYVTDHAVALTGLESETRYYFRVRSADRAGNASAVDAPDSFETFSTLPTLLIDPWEVSAAAGDTLTLAVRALNVTGLFQVAFDVGLGEVVEFEADTLSVGPFLGDEYQALWLYDGGTRVLEVGITRLYPAAGVAGDGTIGWLHLRVQGSGTGVVGFREGSIALRTPSGELISDFDQLRTLESTVEVD